MPNLEIFLLAWNLQTFILGKLQRLLDNMHKRMCRCYVPDTVLSSPNTVSGISSHSALQGAGIVTLFKRLGK